jgi:hypothetical protein
VARRPDRRVGDQMSARSIAFRSGSPCGAGSRCAPWPGYCSSGRPPAASRPAQPKDSILLAVDQQFGEGATFRVAPELSDPVGAVEVRQHEDVE